MSDNENKNALGLIVLVSGMRDEKGDVWFNEDADGTPFWAAIKIAPEKEDDFNRALFEFRNYGYEIDLSEYAQEIVLQGLPGQAAPSADELAELRRTYGDSVHDMNTTQDWTSSNQYRPDDLGM